MALARPRISRSAAALFASWQLSSAAADALQCAVPANSFAGTQAPDTDDGVALDRFCSFCIVDTILGAALRQSCFAFVHKRKL